MSLCQSIDTLAMAYLDDELASEERRELELHLGECASCKGHLDGERAELDMVRKALVAPPAPDMLKARLARALDAEDKTAAREKGKRWGRFLLPGAAVTAAAAAIAVFLGAGLMSEPKEHRSAVTTEAVRQNIRAMPLEVQGASTGPWLKQNFAAVEPPQFREPSIALIGARVTAIAGHDAAMLKYLVDVGVNRLTLTAVLIADLGDGELQGGTAVKMGKLTLHVYDADGQPAVTYVDERNFGYVFTSERMSIDELLQVVGTSDLISRAQQQIR